MIGSAARGRRCARRRSARRTGEWLENTPEGLPPIRISDRAESLQTAPHEAAGVLLDPRVEKHETRLLCFSRDTITNHSFPAFPVHRASDISIGANQAPPTVFTNHGTRDTNHGLFFTAFFLPPFPSARQGQRSPMSSPRRALARHGSCQGRREPGNNSAPGSRA